MERAGSGGSSAVVPRHEHAAAEWYATCLSDATLAAETYRVQRKALLARGLEVGGRPLCTVMQPRFIAHRRAELLAGISATLSSLLERAGEYLLDSDALLDLVGASEEERDIWSIDPGYAGFTLTSRLDSFMVGDEPKFVEYNAESPAGIAFCDVLTDVFNDLPVVRQWRGNRRPQASVGRRMLLDTILSAYREWGGSGTPSIAVIDWEDVVTRRDFELCAEYFREQGIHTVIVDPRRLEYRDGAVMVADERFDILYRRVLLHELLAKSSELQPVLQAYRDGAVCMVNSPRSKLLHKKTVFALLSDDRLGLPMSAEERSVVDATIPWTRHLHAGETSYHGETVDLIPFLCSHADAFALKPADDYGGRGVVLGWDVERAEWERALENATGGAFIVQERVEVPDAPYPVWQDGVVRFIPLLQDTNPLLFRGRQGPILTRLSSSALLNVTAGTGSSAPTFVLEGEEG